GLEDESRDERYVLYAAKADWTKRRGYVIKLIENRGIRHEHRPEWSLQVICSERGRWENKQNEQRVFTKGQRGLKDAANAGIDIDNGFFGRELARAYALNGNLREDIRG